MRSARGLSAGAVFAGVAFAALFASVRCADVNRGLGAACIRNADCLSGLCSGQECIAQPTLIDGAIESDSGDNGASEAGTDAEADARVGPPDAGMPPKKDSGHPTADAAKDGAPSKDAGDAAIDSTSPLLDGGDASMNDSSAHDSAVPDATKPMDAKVVDAARDGHSDSG
jgi:hypothetical protein